MAVLFLFTAAMLAKVAILQGVFLTVTAFHDCIQPSERVYSSDEGRRRFQHRLKQVPTAADDVIKAAMTRTR